LVIIGGAEDKTDECHILRHFIHLAGGAKARVVVVTVASSFPQEVGETYVQTFRRLGARHVLALDIRQRNEANQAKLVEAVERATAVFFTGGDQVRITNLLGGTELDQVLHRRHESGMVLGGTSAGAAMMSGTMIVEGQSEATPRLGNVRIGPGLEFLHGVIIDQHFGQRGRSGRLLSALAQYPHQLGIGIDELEVMGCGAVTILDAGAASYNDVLERKESQHVAICNVKLHVLTAGFRFNLQDRMPRLAGPAPRLKRSEEKSHVDRNHPGVARP